MVFLLWLESLLSASMHNTKGLFGYAKPCLFQYCYSTPSPSLKHEPKPEQEALQCELGLRALCIDVKAVFLPDKNSTFGLWCLFAFSLVGPHKILLIM